MSQSNSFVPEQVLDRIVTALREAPIPEFDDPFTHPVTGVSFAANPADAVIAEGREVGISGLRASEPITGRPTRRWMRPAMLWGVGSACSILTVLFAVAWLVLWPRDGLAEVVAAVLEQPWVHVQSVDPDSTVSEGWFSRGREISASRSGNSTRYEDYRLKVYFSYHPQEQVLYRGPIVWTSPDDRFESMSEALKVLVETNLPPEKPEADFGVLGIQPHKLQVLDQRIEKVVEGDKNWVDYRVTVKDAKFTAPVRMLFRVDPSTKLPHLCRIEGKVDDKAVSREVRFDYPATGPVDIYAMGVPKTAKLVDRVPADDLKLIVESLKAGRERMDPYRAVFVDLYEGVQHEWWLGHPQVFSRKGDRFRRDLLVDGPKRKEIVKPAAATDQCKWWWEHTTQYKLLPNSIVCGPMTYFRDRTSIRNSDGSERWEINWHQPQVSNLDPGDRIPVDYAMRPEFICRPPMGLGNENMEPTLDLHPAEGPKGCILLSVRHTEKKTGVNKPQTEEEPAKAEENGATEVHRYWLDPQRDYIVMHWDMVLVDESGKETITHSQTIEEVARSPQGVWYATRTRLKNAIHYPNGKLPDDQIYQLYVDFDADLPDALFEPPTVR